MFHIKKKSVYAVFYSSKKYLRSIVRSNPASLIYILNVSNKVYSTHTIELAFLPLATIWLPDNRATSDEFDETV